MPSLLGGALSSTGHQLGAMHSPTLWTLCCLTLWSLYPSEESPAWAGDVVVWQTWEWGCARGYSSHFPHNLIDTSPTLLPPPHRKFASPNLQAPCGLTLPTPGGFVLPRSGQIQDRLSFAALRRGPLPPPSPKPDWHRPLTGDPLALSSQLLVALPC